MKRPPRIPEGPPQRFNTIWLQEKIPVLLRPREEPPLYVSLPYGGDNRSFLQECGRIHPQSKRSDKTGKWHWEVPMAWFPKLIRRCLNRYGRVYVIQPLNRTEVCARSCWEAKRDTCECSCFGTNHGGGQPPGDWKEISEIFAISHQGGELACQLLVRPAAT